MTTVLYRDEELLIVLKPRGISVQPGEKAGRTILELVKQDLGLDVKPVHRLDRETEGPLALALTKEAAARYSRIIESREARKEYQAICAGAFRRQAGFMDTDIIQHGESKSAGTAFQVTRTWDTESGKVTLVSLELTTGRMHQIRIHLAEALTPIIGDDKHGNFASNKIFKKEFGARHLMLASRRLTLGSIVAEAPLPAHMADFMERLDAAGGTP